MPAIDIIKSALLGIVRKGDDHTSRQILLMLCLRSGPGTVRALADEMGVIKPAIVRGVNRLEVDHYAERRPDPPDRRSVKIVLTKRGEKFVDDMLKTAEKAT